MAMVCDRCKGKQEVAHTVVSLRRPSGLVFGGLADIDPNERQPAADMCRQCRSSLRSVIHGFLRPSDQEG